MLKFSGTFKTRGFDSFGPSKSRKGGYHVRNASTLKRASRQRSYGATPG